MTIHHEYDSDTDLWVLMVAVPGMSATPAGPRIFRAPPHPDVEFSHATQEGAERGAALIRKYISELPVKKQSSAKYVA